MRPMAELYNGSNELAAIFHKKGYEDLTTSIVKGRKVKQPFFVPGLCSSFSRDADTSTSLHRTLAGLHF